jgi:hypothetical protein
MMFEEQHMSNTTTTTLRVIMLLRDIMTLLWDVSSRSHLFPSHFFGFGDAVWTLATVGAQTLSLGKEPPLLALGRSTLSCELRNFSLIEWLM